MLSNEQKKRSGRKARFPSRLHDLLSFAEATGLEAIISWELNGTGIKIHNPGMLVDQLLPHFFELTKYRSFRRQLNMWHFHRIADGPNKGVFVHPYFVKHDPALSGLMSRQIELQPLKEASVEKPSEISSQAICKSMMPPNDVNAFPLREQSTITLLDSLPLDYFE